ncbi:lipid II:glycine glycyltransferase FemX [Paenibacillus flagellatus]|uniref:Lipid II:glycine glycyltransferase n=1 Tax=Paenibacillus flagellatus TaxID=2211139 RepID=A0A2V5L332_9BACL|nr:GNAT family N-acetyltransferase [Paenibacillus flagellatus]PYI57186.1 GNAT family N-acetyltransferase [Paenibacillus flagellatus]
MKFEVISGDNQERWNHYILLLPEADIYFTAEYCKIYEKNGEGKATLAVYEDGDNIICYPYLLRSINHLPIIRTLDLQEEWYDITTPYGYGGPISNIKEPQKRERLFADFQKRFGQYCQENRIIAEFVRFHPILKNYEYYRAVNPVFMRNTIHVSLEGTEQEINQRFSPDNRNRIRKAKKEGLTTNFSDPKRLEHLVRLYYSTMDRKHANGYYYFSENFFTNTVSLLEGHVQLIEVKAGNLVVASSLFMHYNKYVHYHLMGASREYLRLAPVNLLLSEAIQWAKDKGYQYMHLGGGYTGNDNLFRFKRTFNSESVLDYYIGRKVHLPEVYGHISKCLNMSDEYFPVYRHPLLEQHIRMTATTIS